MACCTAAGLVYYDARIRHRDRVVSPNIKNNLEYDTYDLRDEKERSRVANAVPQSDIDKANSVVQPITTLETALQKAIREEKDPFLKAEMIRAMELETSKMERVQKSTMMVTSEQLEQREPHWNVRNNERNWSIMARDQQKQKDSYVYRNDRSRDDDFGRNSGK
eukprot:GDKJ01011757.1.p1 GENE.GDKJ01011757.1~~GDKJ01011757.1.p1  ORF type:complete len:164 (-),score=12.42 GDKJ01011757.1:125-616(-)